MRVPAHTYLGQSDTTTEALACLRRDLLSGETVCDEEHRISIWQALLLPEDQEPLTSDVIRRSRDQANGLHSKYAKCRPETEVDPLSDSPAWTTYYRDEELLATIEQDCARISPDIQWFQGSEQQTILKDCLFIWAKDNAHISYKQGMHELAAIVLWVVLHGPATEYHFQDTYAIFSKILLQITGYYVVSKPCVSGILEHADRIQAGLLPILDAELARRLEQLSIEPQLYCMKWLRLMFSREFPLHMVLSLWDNLFAADKTLELMDLICCAMLIRIRDGILKNDYNTVLTTVLHYPDSEDDPRSFVLDALVLRKQLHTAQGVNRIAKGENHDLVSSSTSNSVQKSLPVGSHAIGALLEQTDKLGINSYVRGAVEEVKRNVTPMIAETRQALHRVQSRDTNLVPNNNEGAHLRRDRELAAILALTISNLKNGDPIEENIKRLEDIKLVLQGRKELTNLSSSHTSIETPINIRPSSAPQALNSSSTSSRVSMPLRIPAIRSKAVSPARSISVEIAEPTTTDKEIPLSNSPKRGSLKKASDYGFLFSEDKPFASTFNKPRKL